MADESRERYLNEMISGFKRSELNDIAHSFGLNANDFPNKRAIAEAILVYREQEEASMKETYTEVLEEAPTAISEINEKVLFEKEISDVVPGEVMKEVKKVSTVKGMVKNYDIYIKNEFSKGLDAFIDSVKELVADYDSYMKNEFLTSLDNYQNSVKELAADYDSYIKNIFSKAVHKYQKSIRHQFRENQDFIKKFYG